MRDKQGFTLIEILFVVVIIGILAAVVIPRLTETRSTANENACDANLANINTQIERYYFNTGSWPASNLAEMIPTTTYDYFPSGLPTCPVTTSESYRMNTTTHRTHDNSSVGTHDHTP
ncbi:MAG: type II secretion system protein [Candidatus Omnitrophica bacterium]|nr:type II secretion system protein [Candidatus Omnitrophota bacterium]